MRVLNILSKSYASAWQNIAAWTNEVPYLPPYGLADVTLEFVNYAYYAAPGGGNRTVRIAGATGGLPPTWMAAVGATLLITLPADWQQEGFEVGGALLIYVEQSNVALGLYNATILALNGQTATVRVNNVVFQTIQLPALERDEDSIIFVQDFSAASTVGVVVRDGEENAFSSALNTNSLFAPHPNRAALLSSASAGTFDVSTPLWATVPSISINRQQAALRIGHFWPLQDSANLAAQAPQSLYPNRLWLLFGSSEQHFVKIQLSTSQLNLYENNHPITQTVTVSGNNTTGYTPSAPGAVAAFVALHNRTLAHQSAASDVQALLQSKPSGVFSFVPPAPQVVGVGVYYNAASGWGGKLSPAAPLAVTSPLVQVRFAQRFQPFTSSSNIYIRPYDAVPVEVEWDNTIGVVLDFRVELYDINANELIDAYSKDDARTLYHYKYDEATLTGSNALQIMLLESTSEHYKYLAGSRVWVRLYGKKNLTYSPGVLSIICKIRAILYTNRGVFIAEDRSDAAFFPLTNAGTWTETPTHVQWSVFIDTPAPSGVLTPDRVLHFVYRAAVFVNDINDTPLSQSNNEFPNPDYTTSPLIQPYGDTTFTIQFPKPTSPGSYKFYVRLSAYKYDPDNITAGINFETTFAEVFELVVPPPLPPAPQGGSECIVCIPRLAGETITLLFPEPPTAPGGSPLPHTPAGDWYQYTLPLAGAVCFEKYHCGWYETQEIQLYYVDLLMNFDNRVWGRVVQGTNFLRVAGELERISDEIETERYVTKLYDEDDILRAFRARYRLTAVVRSACELWALELAKYAKTIDITARRGLVRSVEGLVVESFEIQDTKASLIRVTITLRERVFRREYRY